MHPKAPWVGWQELDDPPAGEVDAGLLGGIGWHRVASERGSRPSRTRSLITRQNSPSCKPVDYDKAMKLIRHDIAQGWKISGAQSKKQPYTPWALTPIGSTPLAKPHRGGRGQKHRCKHDPGDEVDPTGASDSVGEPEAKHERRYSPRRPNRSASPAQPCQWVPPRQPTGKA